MRLFPQPALNVPHVPEGYIDALSPLTNSRYSLLVAAYLLGQYRLQLTDREINDVSAPPGHGGIVRELCTYRRETAVEVGMAIERAEDPVSYCESLTRPWNCEYEGGRIRLDNRPENRPRT